MHRPNFDQMTDKEKMQFAVVINEFLGQQLAASKRHKQVQEAKQIIELEQEKNQNA